MIYLYVIEPYLKVIIAVFYFCHSNNSSNIMKKILNSAPIYSWIKKFLVKKYDTSVLSGNKVSLQKLIKFRL